MNLDSQPKIIINWKGDFDPYNIYKKDELLVKSIHNVHLTIGKINPRVVSVIEDNKLMPATASVLSYLMSRKKTKRRDDKDWVFITQDHLCEKTGYKSRDTLRRAVLQLKALGLIETTNKYNAINPKNKYRLPTLWYSLNMETINQFFDYVPNLNHHLLRYTQTKSRKAAVRNKHSKENGTITTAEKIVDRKAQSFIKKRFDRYGCITYPEKYQQLKTYSAHNLSKNKKFYFYQNPRDNFNFFNEKKNNNQSNIRRFRQVEPKKKNSLINSPIKQAGCTSAIRSLSSILNSINPIFSTAG